MLRREHDFKEGQFQQRHPRDVRGEEIHAALVGEALKDPPPRDGEILVVVVDVPQVEEVSLVFQLGLVSVFWRKVSF